MTSHVPKHTASRGDDHPAAVDREEHEAEIVGAVELFRNGVGHAGGAEIVLEQALEDERQAEGEQEAVERIETGEPLEEQPLDHGPYGADDQRRQDQRIPVIEAGQGQQEIGGEGAHHVERAVREIDDIQHAEDDGKAEAEQRVERAVDQPDEQLAESAGMLITCPKRVIGRTPHPALRATFSRKREKGFAPSPVYGRGLG